MIKKQTSSQVSAQTINPRRAGIIAGLGYIALFILAIFANFIVKEGLIVPGNAKITAANILNAPGMFRSGMVSFLAVFLIDVFVAWSLYIIFRPVNPEQSLLAAWFRIVYTVFLGVALVFYFEALQYLDLGQDFYDQALISLESFNSVWLIGLSAFGVHLIILGTMILRSKIAPRLLGYFLILAGASYILDTVFHTQMADYYEIAGLMTAIVAIPSVISEGWFGIWLLMRGGTTESYLETDTKQLRQSL